MFTSENVNIHALHPREKRFIQQKKPKDTMAFQAVCARLEEKFSFELLRAPFHEP